MARPYAGSAGTHMFFGLLSIAAGITWLCLLYFYKPMFVTTSILTEPVSIFTLLPAWVTVLLSVKIISGFWFFVTGAAGCSIRTRGCGEGVYIALNILNVILWAPVLMGVMILVGLIILVLPDLLQSADINEINDLVLLFGNFVWLWVFLGIGLLVGIVEFILSIVSYSIVCCCRPSSLDQGYEYQYELK